MGGIKANGLMAARAGHLLPALGSAHHRLNLRPRISDRNVSARSRRCAAPGRAEQREQKPGALGHEFQLPRTFLISPTFCWIWPAIFSDLPLASIRGLPISLPAASLTLPAICRAEPCALSLVL